jgi:hypothetical protein
MSESSQINGHTASQEQLQHERERLLRQQQEQSPNVRLPAPKEVDVSTIFPVSFTCTTTVTCPDIF